MIEMVLLGAGILYYLFSQEDTLPQTPPVPAAPDAPSGHAQPTPPPPPPPPPPTPQPPDSPPAPMQPSSDWVASQFSQVNQLAVTLFGQVSCRQILPKNQFPSGMNADEKKAYMNAQVYCGGQDSSAIVPAVYGNLIKKYIL